MVKEAQTYAEDTGLLFMETSAKTAMNVNELFLAIGECYCVLYKNNFFHRRDWDNRALPRELYACHSLNTPLLFNVAKKMPKTDTQNPTHAARHRGVNLQDPDAHSTRACCGGN